MKERMDATGSCARLRRLTARSRLAEAFSAVESSVFVYPESGRRLTTSRAASHTVLFSSRCTTVTGPAIESPCAGRLADLLTDGCAAAVGVALARSGAGAATRFGSTAGGLT